MPDPNAQIPTPDEIIGKGIDALVTLRPRALAQINGGKGVYSHIFAGWRAQAAVVIRRLANHVKNGRLRFAEAGAPLNELAESEFDSLPDLGPTAAVGQVVLFRSGSLPGGSIRRGTRFTRRADPSSQQLWGVATYECASDIYVRQGDATVEVPLVARLPGSASNLPNFGVPQTGLEISDDIVDRAAWSVYAYEVAGGSDGADADDVRRYATAYAQGQYAPNDQAALVGAYRAGARHVLLVQDPATASLRLYMADASWAGSTRWAKAVRQQMSDERFIGFGCKVLTFFVANQIVAVEAVAKVRQPEYLNETSDLDSAIQTALRAYFDDRPDWNRWSLAALRGVVARADRRILSCSSVAVKTLAGATVAEPASSSTTHFMLLDNAVRVSYLSPT